MAIKILGLRRDFQQGTDEVDVEKSQFKPKFHAANEQLFADLFTNDPNYLLVSSSPKVFSAIHEEDFTENFYIHEEELEEYLDGFISVIKENGDDTIESTQEDIDQILSDAALDDKDIKLSLYRSFKSLYDKWISSSENSTDNSGYFFNNYGKDDDRLLYDHFRFINRANQNIGGKAVIDPAYLSNLANADNGQGGPTQSLYQTLTGLLSKNNFDFWPTPANIDLKVDSMSDEDLKDMFRPLDYVNKLNPGPIFNCVYVGGSSRFLKDLNNKEGNCQLINDFNYSDDSFDITTPQDWPEEFKDAEDKGIVAFKVRYGQEAQNHFDTLKLDQTEFKETQESLMIIDALANPRQGNSPATAGKGNNMYDIYLTRSYNCTVSGLGNMSIQPLMYFKLENVPMFRGTYLINEVKHTISPHNIKTEFKGLRQPKITVPIVEDPISLVDLLLSNEGFEGTPGSLGGIGGSGINFTSDDIEQFTSQEKVAKGCEIANRLVNDLNISLVQACGIVGNLIAESGLVPDRIQGSGVITGLITESGGWNGSSFSKSDVKGYGWAQWTYYTLKNSFIEYAKAQGVDLTTKPATDEINYGYVLKWIEIEGTRKFNKFKETTTIFDAAKYVAVEWERCKKCKELSSQKKRAGFAQQVYDYCNGTGSSNSGTSTPKAQSGCDKKAVPIGLNGSGNLGGALNVIVGSSSVGTLNGIKSNSTNGSLTSNNVSVYYNCPGKTLAWLSSQVIGDTNKYDSVKTYFQVGIGTNDGYPIDNTTKSRIKTYTAKLKQNFPNATLYVLPGTYGWGSVKGNDYTKQRLKNYYKQYEDEGWTLLWPNKSGNEIDPNFDTSSKAHKSGSDWFQYQMKILKDYGV
jgi:hypothetical protein